MSARWISCSTAVPCSGAHAMPMLASTSSVSPSIEERLAQLREQVVRDRARVRGAREVAQQHAELVAAEARDRVRLLERGAQAHRHLLEQPVAGVVAERVVDLLEVVEVDQHHRGGAIPAAAGADHLLDAVAEQRAVRQAGERVVERLVLLGDRLAATAVDGEQRQEEQRHGRQGEVGGEGDHRREAQHQAAGGDLEEPVLDDVTADPQALHEGDHGGDQRGVDQEEDGCGCEDAGQVGGREVELVAEVGDVGQQPEHERGGRERDHVLRRVEQQLERRLALDDVRGEARADQRDHGARRAGGEQGGEREGGRGRDLALSAAGYDLQ